MSSRERRQLPVIWIRARSKIFQDFSGAWKLTSLFWLGALYTVCELRHSVQTCVKCEQTKQFFLVLKKNAFKSQGVDNLLKSGLLCVSFARVFKRRVAIVLFMVQIQYIWRRTGCGQRRRCKDLRTLFNILSSLTVSWSKSYIRFVEKSFKGKGL